MVMVTQGRIYFKRGPCSEKMWGPLIYEYPVTPHRLPSPYTVGADKIVSFIPWSLFQYFWLVTMLQKMTQLFLSFCGASGVTMGWLLRLMTGGKKLTFGSFSLVIFHILLLLTVASAWFLLPGAILRNFSGCTIFRGPPLPLGVCLLYTSPSPRD